MDREMRASDPAADIAEEIRRKLKEYEDAVAEEQDAAICASLLADELRDLGFDVDEHA